MRFSLNDFYHLISIIQCQSVSSLDQKNTQLQYRFNVCWFTICLLKFLNFKGLGTKFKEVLFVFFNYFNRSQRSFQRSF